MDFLLQAIDIFLHLDRYLDVIIQQYGNVVYGVLFLIVFCETGLVVTPFLPGDSLLFAAGTFAGRGVLDPFLLFFLLTVAAIFGDFVNYSAGKYIGPRAFKQETGFFFNRKHLIRTQEFYERYGSQTIIIARFVPIVRTFAPFVAGIGHMNYRRFISYNVFGAVLWTSVCIALGYFFGNIPIVRDNFSLAALGIIFVSILPALIEALRIRLSKRKTTQTTP